MKAFLRPWCLGAAMSALYALAIVLGFWRVLAPDVVFVAPDAPLAPLTFGEAVRQLFSTPPTLQNLVFLLPYRFAYEGTFWVDGYVMCLAAVFLLRGRGVGWGAAWVGGLCAAFAGYFATLFCAGHRGVVDALSVGCLGFGALLRGVRTGRVRWFALLAAANALSLAAQADIWLLVALAQGAYALWLLWRERPAWRPLARGAAVAAAVFLVVGWPALRHTFVDARQTRADQLAQAQAAAQSPAQAAAAQWRFITDWSLPPEDLVEWFLPGAIGHTSYPFDPKPYTGRIGSAHQTLRQHTVHVGWPAMLLAAAAIVLLARRDPSARDLPFWYALAAVALLLALGRHTPLYRAVATLPFLDQIRAPVKWLHLTGFALAVAAGVGAQALTRRWAWAAFPLAAAVALCGALVIRPYVFPRDLRHTPLTDALPPGANLCNAVRWPLLDDVCRWHRIPLSTDPRAADYAVAPVPQPGLTPVATQTLAQPPLTLGLYRLR